jgi:hypothetical protein
MHRQLMFLGLLAVVAGLVMAVAPVPIETAIAFIVGGAALIIWTLVKRERPDA